MLLSTLIPALALGLAPALPTSQEPAGAPETTTQVATEAPASEVELIYLANEGFLVRYGGEGFLIDAFVKDRYSIYAPLPREVYKQMVAAESPFDLEMIVLTSHDHGDHFQTDPAEKFMRRNKKTLLMTSPQVIQTFKDGAEDFKSVRQRVRDVLPRPGKTMVMEDGERKVEFLRLRHAGEENRSLQNLGHLLTISGFKVLHVGDADMNVDMFAEYGLGQRDIDVFLCPFWYFGAPDGEKILKEIDADLVVACHIPPRKRSEIEKFLAENHPDVVMFRESLESRSFALPSAAGTDE